ncbi:MAG: hypothetical protein HQ553_02075 [Chloroflexi bacterium]|nr:hypothetical protein [Chloroflexota bacterium]
MAIAIVLYMNVPGLGVTRSLGKEGVEVYGIDRYPDAVAFSSKFCKKSFVFADPITAPAKLLDQMIELGKGLDEKAVLLPTSDYYTDFVSTFRTELSEYFLFNIPSSSILKTLIDKSQQYTLASQLGITIPATFSPGSKDELMEKGSTISYPAFIKGVSSHEWYSYFENKGFVAHSFDELQEYYNLISSKDLRIVVQEIVEGPNKNHYKVCAYYSKEQKLLALFSTQKTRQFPADFGIGSFMTSMKCPELIETSLKFFEGMGYTGVGSIEFKKDDKDGQFKLLELNPRFWKQNNHPTFAGVNFAYINYLDCIGKELAPSLNFRENVHWLNTVEDIGSFLANRKKGDISTTEWLRSLFKTNCHAFFQRDDLGPVWWNAKDVIGIHSKKALNILKTKKPNSALHL